MKKIIVTLVAMMAVTFSFAETNSNNVDRRFDMSCNMDQRCSTWTRISRKP